jgi:hypothetical protein
VSLPTLFGITVSAECLAHHALLLLLHKRDASVAVTSHDDRLAKLWLLDHTQ